MTQTFIDKMNAEPDLAELERMWAARQKLANMDIVEPISDEERQAYTYRAAQLRIAQARGGR